MVKPDLNLGGLIISNLCKIMQVLDKLTQQQKPYHHIHSNEDTTMQIEITGHQIDVTNSMRDYFNNKFTRIKRHFDQVINVHAILSVEKIYHKAEATININGKTLFAESTEEDLYAAIDLLIDKLDKQVRRHKDKTTSKSRGEALKYSI